MTDRGDKPSGRPSGNVASIVPFSSSKSERQSHRQSPRSHNPPSVVVPIAQFHPEFDVVQQLGEERELYQGDEQATVYNLPEYIRTCLDRIRARVVSVSKPGMSPTLTCCITCGLETILKIPDVQRLIKLKEQLDLCDNVDAWVLEEVVSVSRRFSLGLVDTTSGSAQSKQNFTIPADTRNRVGNLSSELGVNFSTIAILSIMISLVDQPAILAERKDEIVKSVNLFIRRVRVRLIMMEALLKVMIETREPK